ncbi:hypothetical protein BC830DRAFT_1166203 [Chytriomyces sp. MP71]|nr:hypothetical protein BC830DRAFT_1166203 [Chytriomyces sp. MP71]
MGVEIVSPVGAEARLVAAAKNLRDGCDNLHCDGGEDGGGGAGSGAVLRLSVALDRFLRSQFAIAAVASLSEAVPDDADGGAVRGEKRGRVSGREEGAEGLLPDEDDDEEDEAGGLARFRPRRRIDRPFPASLYGPNNAWDRSSNGGEEWVLVGSPHEPAPTPHNANARSHSRQYQQDIASLTRRMHRIQTRPRPHSYRDTASVAFLRAPFLAPPLPAARQARPPAPLDTDPSSDSESDSPPEMSQVTSRTAERDWVGRLRASLHPPNPSELNEAARNERTEPQNGMSWRTRSIINDTTNNSSHNTPRTFPTSSSMEFGAVFGDLFDEEQEPVSMPVSGSASAPTSPDYWQRMRRDAVLNGLVLPSHWLVDEESADEPAEEVAAVFTGEWTNANKILLRAEEVRVSSGSPSLLPPPSLILAVYSYSDYGPWYPHSHMDFFKQQIAGAVAQQAEENFIEQTAEQFLGKEMGGKVADIVQEQLSGKGPTDPNAIMAEIAAPPKKHGFAAFLENLAPHHQDAFNGLQAHQQAALQQHIAANPSTDPTALMAQIMGAAGGAGGAQTAGGNEAIMGLLGGLLGGAGAAGAPAQAAEQSFQTQKHNW